MQIIYLRFCDKAISIRNTYIHSIFILDSIFIHDIAVPILMLIIPTPQLQLHPTTYRVIFIDHLCTARILLYSAKHTVW